MLGVQCEHSHQENIRIKCSTCFSFFQNKVLSFLNNGTDEISSNDMDEDESMMAAVHKLSNSVMNYASHCLHANMQFYVIDKLFIQ